MPPGDDGPVEPRQYLVVVDAKTWETVTPDDRRAAEREAVKAIVSLSPPEEQETMRRILEGDGSGADIAVVSSTDPELARLFGIIGSIRQAEWQSRKSSELRVPLYLGAEPPRKDVRVNIALVPQLARPDVRATVIRRPGDLGRPLLLLRESDLTASDLELGLRAAAVAFRRYGPTPARERALHLRTGRPALQQRVERAEHYLDLVKAGRPRHIDGIGTVPAMAIITSLDRLPKRHES